MFVLYTGGQLTINRGYLIDSGIVPPDDVGRLDEQLRHLFPTARWGEKSYYLTTATPDAAAVDSFARWLPPRQPAPPTGAANRTRL